MSSPAMVTGAIRGSDVMLLRECGVRSQRCAVALAAWYLEKRQRVWTLGRGMEGFVGVISTVLFQDWYFLSPRAGKAITEKSIESARIVFMGCFECQFVLSPCYGGRVAENGVGFRFVVAPPKRVSRV